MAASPPLLLLLSFFVLLISQPATSTPPSSLGFSLQLIDRDSVHSPFYPANLTIEQRIHRMVDLSDARIRWLNTSILGPQVATIRPPVGHEAWKYMVALGIGSPPVVQILLLDTSSDTVWTQCHPCTHCFHHDPPLFWPSSSRTFQVLPCSHPLCMPRTCLNQICIFSKRYLGGTFTGGRVAIDRFTSRSTTPNPEAIGDIVFGCATESSSVMFQGTNKLTGILGMDGGPRSFVSQLGARIQHRFSYCLIPNNQQGFSYLRFGNDIVAARNAQHTPLVLIDTGKVYYLNLMGISINNRRLYLPEGTFAYHSDGTGGCVIDSGASFSYLIKPAFDSVKNSLTGYFRQFNIPIVNHPELLCYNRPRGFRAFPSMTLHFQGANLILGTENLFHLSDERFCLVIRSDNHFTILGAVQQTNFQFIFDTRRRELTFAPMNCVQR